MGSPGRKRKDSPRTPSGQLSRSLQNSKGVALAARARTDVLRALGHPELGTIAGRWFLTGDLPGTSWDAAQKLCRLSVEYDIAIDRPPRSPLAQDINKVSKATGGGGVENVEWKRARVSAMDGVKLVLGAAAFRAVERVIIEDRMPDDYCQRLLSIEACRLLATHWGITRG